MMSKEHHLAVLPDLDVEPLREATRRQAGSASLV